MEPYPSPIAVPNYKPLKTSPAPAAPSLSPSLPSAASLPRSSLTVLSQSHSTSDGGDDGDEGLGFDVDELEREAKDAARDHSRSISRELSIESEEASEGTELKGKKKRRNFVPGQVPDHLLPKVVIIGRPNVGKSALFNRLVGAVHEASVARMPSLIERQAATAVEESSVIIFLVDGQAGPTAGDEEIARKNIVLAVNKCESPRKGLMQAMEFWNLGFLLIAISAITGTGTGEMVRLLCSGLKKIELSFEEGCRGLVFSPESENLEEEENRTPAIVIVGKPNVGISSILNALVGEERTIICSLQRSYALKSLQQSKAIGDNIVWLQKFRLIDPAGIRKKASVASSGSTTEALSVNRAFQAVRRSDVVAFVIDALVCVTEQDYKIADRIEKEGKGIIVAASEVEKEKSRRLGSYQAANILSFFVNDAKLFNELYRHYMEKQLHKDAGFPGTPIRLLWRSRKKMDKVADSTPIKSHHRSHHPQIESKTHSPSTLSLIPPTPPTKTPSGRGRSRGSSNQISSPVPSPPRRFSRHLSLNLTDPATPTKEIDRGSGLLDDSRAKNPRNWGKCDEGVDGVSFMPKSPELDEGKKRKRRGGAMGRGRKAGKKKVYYKKVEYDGCKFEAGDDVYLKRREDASSDDEDPEVEECRVCFDVGSEVMVECDECLGGFHLRCLRPPLKEVPEGDWVCGFCEARKRGKVVEMPALPKGKKRVRTLREKLLTGDLWAARIDSIWKEVDGTFWLSGHWYVIPEETAAGRQAHNLRRELWSPSFGIVLLRVPKNSLKLVMKAMIYFCVEYEYDTHCQSFKRLAEIDNKEQDDNEDISDVEEDTDFDEERTKNGHSRLSSSQLAANSRKGRIFGLQKLGIKKIPEHLRHHKQTELERAKKTLLLATWPCSPPCRNREMEEITTFVRGAVCDDQCLGRCLYIHGVPGTGKTMSVLAAIKSLRSEVDAGIVRPFSFIEINGLKLATPESIYRVIYEALSGHRVNWKKALNCLNERFSEGKEIGKGKNKPCVLLIDELDLLVNKNQSVLYNILDWPTKPNSKLVVIGIANTMDLPEKLLPRISSRMGIQRLRFEPYNNQQLQEIILSRLRGINAFENQAVEFASRKVAAVSGDARRALEICRRAAEIKDYHIKHQTSKNDAASIGKPMVGVPEVKAAIQEMFEAPHIQIMRKSSKMSKIFLAAMVHELYKTGMGETTFEKLTITASRFCTSNGMPFPGWDMLLRISCRLGESKIVLCEPGSKHRLQKLQLNFPSDDVTFALKDCKELPWLAKYLCC
ncbi:Origin of replication complex subunit 1A-like protein [Drosera capensis]